jgi:catechol 2,3-dioxygenase-like lactoylglutathione lyase family enzyme
MRSLFPAICTDDVVSSVRFYQRLLGLVPVFEADFYVQLRAPDNPAAQVAFVRRTHPSVPQGYQNRAEGVVVTVEVNDARQLHARAVHLEVPIVLSLRDEPWGQRHFMIRDPDGLLLDIAQIIPPSPEQAGARTIG